MTRKADLIAAKALESVRKSLTGKSIDLEVYDEATDGLDAAGESSFVQLLREECLGTTIFVSHKSLVSENVFDKVIKIRKHDDVSEVLVD